jgi:hypothetical protein
MIRVSNTGARTVGVSTIRTSVGAAVHHRRYCSPTRALMSAFIAPPDAGVVDAVLSLTRRHKNK